MPRGRAFDTLMNDISQSIRSVKNPTEFLINLFYSIPILGTLRICTEAGIFLRLAQAAREERSLTAADLAANLTPGATGDELASRKDFIVRVLRPCCALNLVDEPGPFTYHANALTLALADPGLSTGFNMLFDNALGPKSTVKDMLALAKSAGYQSPSSSTNGPYQTAHGTVRTSTFQTWVTEDPEQLTRLSTFMQRLQRDRVHWTEWFPADSLFDAESAADPEPIFLVDVGGGRGHDIAALAAKYPDKAVRFVLQDQEIVILDDISERRHSGMKLDSRISLSTHDFFEPQPIPGARIYYMHKVLHDWPDQDCVKILSHLRDGMAPGSRILINDVILPVKDCPLLPVAFDVTMWALHSGAERDEEQYTRLIAKVEGLKIIKFWHPPNGDGEGIVEVVRT